MNSMFILLCDFFVVWEYDEWVVILFIEFFTMYFEMQILFIWNNHEYGVLMNDNVSVLKIKAKIVNVCMWSVNLLYSKVE